MKGRHGRFDKRLVCAMVLAFCLAVAAMASETIGTNVWSAAMGKPIPVTLVLPDAYRTSVSSRWPVAYMLHGYGGNDREYLEKTRQIGPAVDEYGFVAICPDGAASSWWMDSPVDPKMRYATFVARELVAWADGHLRTIADRRMRAVAGASMGGYGAMTIACRNKDVFGAVGSIHGGVDLVPFKSRWQIQDMLGPYEGNEDRWREHSAIARAKGVHNGELEIMMVIGTADPYFLDGNRRLHELFATNGVAHAYVELTGRTADDCAHNFRFQRTGEQWLYPFLSRFFAAGREETKK